MNKNYSKVYVVISDGEVVYASEEREMAVGFAHTKTCEAGQRVLDEYGNDDPSDRDMAEAVFQAGFDGDYYEVVKVDISGLDSDDVVELDSGEELDVSDILEAMSEEDFFK